MSGDPQRELWAELDRAAQRARELGVARDAALHMRALAADLEREASAVAGQEEFPGRYGLIGESPAMAELFQVLERVIPSDVSVLIRGDTGTGKELVARALHHFGPRAEGPFVAVNCAAVPANLLESELFGHKRGAFTGAVADREGHFAAAHKGTLFLDEIGDMPLPMQAKLLRALEEREVRPVGANRARRVDVRVLSATHRDLVAASAKGQFREDLYFRLAVVTLWVPPLRARVGDVALLARALLHKLSRELHRPAPRLLPEALARLEAWPWPGNVRELENELRRALALCSGDIGPADLSPHIGAG